MNLIPQQVRDRFGTLLDPLAPLLIRWHVRPNLITTVGTLGAVGRGAVVLRAGALLRGGGGAGRSRGAGGGGEARGARRGAARVRGAGAGRGARGLGGGGARGAGRARAGARRADRGVRGREP